ncbi:MAG: hypothetical protein RIR39_554 [Pseudomonadota bacterium]|jgi:hypothetical protein
MELCPTQKEDKFYAFPYLQNKYKNWLKPEITQINLLHKSGSCYLEITCELPEPKDPDEKQKLVQEIDMSFISCFSEASDSIFQDAKTLIEEFDAYSIINTLPLFTEAACELINNSYHANKNS